MTFKIILIDFNHNHQNPLDIIQNHLHSYLTPRYCQLLDVNFYLLTILLTSMLTQAFS